MTTAAVPAFLSNSSKFGLCVPTSRWPKDNVAGWVTICGPVPCPPKPTVCGEITALSAILILPPTALVFGGVKINLMVQAEPGAISVQSSVGTTEGSVDSAEATVSGALPQLVTF